MPQGVNVNGPVQVANQIQSDQTISAQFTLLSRGGSNVKRGQIQLIPVGTSIVYVQPIYVQQSGNQGYPRLSFVVVFTQGRSPVMANDRERGHRRALQRSRRRRPRRRPRAVRHRRPRRRAAPTPSTTAPSGNQTVASLLQQAQAKFNDAQTPADGRQPRGLPAGHQGRPGPRRPGPAAPQLRGRGGIGVHDLDGAVGGASRQATRRPGTPRSRDCRVPGLLGHQGIVTICVVRNSRRPVGRRTAPSSGPESPHGRQRHRSRQVQARLVTTAPRTTSTRPRRASTRTSSSEISGAQERAGVDDEVPAQRAEAVRAQADARLVRQEHARHRLRRHLLLPQADRGSGLRLGHAPRGDEDHLREARHPRGRAQVPRRRHRAVRVPPWVDAGLDDRTACAPIKELEPGDEVFSLDETTKQIVRSRGRRCRVLRRQGSLRDPRARPRSSARRRTTRSSCCATSARPGRQRAPLRRALDAGRGSARR